jgi:hypothetical protein
MSGRNYKFIVEDYYLPYNALTSAKVQTTSSAKEEFSVA